MTQADRIMAAIRKMACTCKSKRCPPADCMAELRAYWTAINEDQPDAARDPRVIAAKDERKAEIMRRMA